jgi:Beta-galactosidase, domain 2
VVVYGGPGELHELAVITSSSAQTVEGSGVNTNTTGGTTILNWQTSTTCRVVQVGNLFIYILDRNTAYNYWVPDFARNDTWLFTRPVEETTSVIAQAGYLVRTTFPLKERLCISTATLIPQYLSRSLARQILLKTFTSTAKSSPLRPMQ